MHVFHLGVIVGRKLKITKLGWCLVSRCS